ncbi:HAMP domain-containing histidine kinase [Paenibacillus sp. HN-1]|uniref:HAMP domain-containing sensor histidine kinase n=1 Tax=Paenibacillus TaxID=44249 RepID=UPI001CA7DB0A|nr:MULTISPECIES: HAMP domain-containing sensor histidine kinase [Paenibacillus]MBY9079345.1 HAMP domain-containing histidine kinase [Paenibacillus sp. CGMCC 1.18879]MBY9086267.1 HAMP domain-containing histidine kinase [Paenibacillus sinensis]
MRKKSKQDRRFNTKSISWKGFLITYFVLSTLTAGQAMIYDAYNPVGKSVPTPYLMGMMGYWIIVSLIFCLLTSYQKNKHFGKPLHKLSIAAKQVAEGDFSVYLEPVHRTDKRDYIDAMFEDFNKMVEELGSIETLKNDFISNVSHEIKTPLSVIQSYAMALQKDELSPELRKDYSETIITASKKLTTLVMNILKLNKLENQEIGHAAKPYDVCRQLAECIIYFENAWEEKNIELVVDIEDRAVIHAEQSMLEIVWHNLLSNAVKFTPPGGTITLTQTSDEDTITVSVSDTGCGMDEMTLKHIFDKFYQGDTSHSGEGNGLGLALSLRVIELVGGVISAKSELGEGSTFTVKLKVEP